MANKKTRKTASRKKTQQTNKRRSGASSNSRSSQSRSGTSNQNRKLRQKEEKRRNEIKTEIALLLVIALFLILVLGNIGLKALVIDKVAYFFFGLIGILEYIFPFLIFALTWFALANRGSKSVKLKVVLSMLAFAFLMAMIQISYDYKKSYSLSYYFKSSASKRSGGGIIGGAISKALVECFGVVGATLMLAILITICLCIITGKTFVKNFISALTKKDSGTDIENEEYDEYEDERLNEKQDDMPYMPFVSEKDKNKKIDTSLLIDFDDNKEEEKKQKRRFFKEKLMPEKEVVQPDSGVDLSLIDDEITGVKTNKSKEPARKSEETFDINEINDDSSKFSNYKIPSLSLLKKGSTKKDSESDARENAFKLQQTINSFGVRANVVSFKKGPSVTQFEIQPEIGVKVKKISDLADDIKLNLAVPDIRIEAPIPGKSVVGIEIPNKESHSVFLRDLLESEEFQGAKSKISFAVGRDIAGNVVVSDIAKLPHLLIGGSTGSGKSVFMNTLIMSILYKASPEEVKFFMIDPKMIELSVYNRIPHLFVPVVTDPKKAAGVLNYAVVEMTKRYKLFKIFGVKNLEEYNKKVVTYEKSEDGKAYVKDGEEYTKKPRIVIVVDEFADLMMVAKGDVEESVCRLAQLARAAGIHLILATQRPSVDVITGLIKANMPSRCALLVSSGTDSRTIIDQTGAEKLLGNGDMLYSPSGMNHPIRVQGAFISSTEVEKVVDDIVKKNGELKNDEEVEDELNNANSLIGGEVAISDNSNDSLDSYFESAGEFVIEKQKASVGMLQRQFRIGFNRAARIMDQLHQAGVVSEEEGTRPRKVLMNSTYEFKNTLDSRVDL